MGWMLYYLVWIGLTLVGTLTFAFWYEGSFWLGIRDVVIGLSISIVTATVFGSILRRAQSKTRDKFRLNPTKEETEAETRWRNRREFWSKIPPLIIFISAVYFLLFGIPYWVAGVPISVTASTLWFFTQNIVLFLPMWLALPFVYLFAFYGPFILKAIFFDISVILPGSATWGVKLDDVRGQKEVVEQVRTLLFQFRAHNELKEKGGKPERGVIFAGPPGTGKTLLAKAIASELGIPLILAPGTAFIQTFIGVDIIVTFWLQYRAESLAKKYGEVIIFMDEFDIVGQRRSSMNGGGLASHLTSNVPIFGSGNMGSGALFRLLVWMDGMEEKPSWFYRFFRDRVNMLLDASFIVPARFRLPAGKAPSYNIFFLAATNRPEVLDPAIKRPGRFGRVLDFYRPGIEEREDVALYYLSKVAHAPELSEGRRLEALVQYTEGMSHAEIEQVIRTASSYRLAKIVKDIGSDSSKQSELKSRIERELYVRWEDVVEAIGTIRYGIAKPRQTTAIGKEKTAYHEAGHLIATKMFLGDKSIPLCFSVLPRGESLGRVHSVPPEERDPRFQKEYEGEIRVLLAAHATERKFFGENTPGVVQDLAHATVMAYAMAGAWGMSPRKCTKEEEKRYQIIGQHIISMVPFNDKTFPQDSFRDSAISLASTVSADVQKKRIAEIILGQAYVDVDRCVLNNKEVIEQATEAVLNSPSGEMVGDELDALYGEIILRPIRTSDPWPEMETESPFYEGEVG